MYKKGDKVRIITEKELRRKYGDHPGQHLDWHGVGFVYGMEFYLGKIATITHIDTDFNKTKIVLDNDYTWLLDCLKPLQMDVKTFNQINR